MLKLQEMTIFCEGKKVFWIGDILLQIVICRLLAIDGFIVSTRGLFKGDSCFFSAQRERKSNFKVWKGLGYL